MNGGDRILRVIDVAAAKSGLNGVIREQSGIKERPRA